MDQNFNTGASTSPVASYNQKSGNGLKIFAAVACVAAVCGIGFGVYGMVQGSQKNSVSDLKIQVKGDNGEVTTVEAPEIETVANGTTVTITNPTTASASSKEYIYVGEWGVKIKIPENLKGVSYIYNNYDHYTLCVDGVANGGQYAPAFADITSNTGGLGCLAQYFGSELTETQKQAAVYSSGDSYLIYSHPQAVHSNSEDEINWEAESANLVQKMLTENVSAF